MKKFFALVLSFLIVAPVVNAEDLDKNLITLSVGETAASMQKTALEASFQRSVILARGRWRTSSTRIYGKLKLTKRGQKRSGYIEFNKKCFSGYGFIQPKDSKYQVNKKYGFYTMTSSGYKYNYRTCKVKRIVRY